MVTQLKLSEQLEFVRSALSCSQVYLCRKIMLPNLDFDSPEYGQRVTQLYEVCLPYIEEKVNKDVLFKILEAHVFPDHMNRHDSVISALIQNKYSLETLKHIAEIAYKRTKQK